MHSDYPTFRSPLFLVALWRLLWWGLNNSHRLAEALAQAARKTSSSALSPIHSRASTTGRRDTESSSLRTPAVLVAPANSHRRLL
ncbi:hypothetical protein GGR50DRAFT_181422 [Xylaria sp. CBS 124048]|nr:hypothetical protein GGR50DRAFT_181422 [Xylaria sp. CBS 124048]